MTPTIVALTVLLACAIGILRGLNESQVFVKPIDWMHLSLPAWLLKRWVERDAWQELVDQFNLGVRGHRWFSWYHAIDGAKDALLIAFGVWLCQFDVRELPVIVALSLMVIWQMGEIGYMYGRYGKMNETEHVVIFDVIDFHAPAIVMHCARAVVICVLAWVAL